MPENKELVEIIKEEIEPVKKEMSVLKEQATNLENDNVELSSKLTSKDKETKALIELKESMARENQAKTTLVEKLKREVESLKLENIELKKQINPLKKNYIALKEKHTKLLERLPILENRIKLAEIELKNKLSASVEKHLKEIIPTAFSRAQRLFEAKFKPIETDLLKEIGALVGPYMAEDREKIENKVNILEKSLLLVKEQSAKQSQILESASVENKKLKGLLKEAKDRLDRASVETFKAKLMEKAPTQVKATLETKLKNVTDKEKCKTIFFETIKRNTAVSNPKINHPAAEIKVSKTNAQQINNDFDSDVAPTDPDMLKLAGITDN
jgi:chromosome segregation ATPase